MILLRIRVWTYPTSQHSQVAANQLPLIHATRLIVKSDFTRTSSLRCFCEESMIDVVRSVQQLTVATAPWQAVPLCWTGFP